MSHPAAFNAPAWFAGAIIDGAGRGFKRRWGAFIQAVLDFGIVAFAIFLVVKLTNRLRKKEQPKPAAPPEEISSCRGKYATH